MDRGVVMSGTDNDAEVFGGNWDVNDPQAQVTVTLTLTAEQAMALAQLSKRAHSSSFAALAANDREATMMAAAMYGPLRDALAAAGFDPR